MAIKDRVAQSHKNKRDVKNVQELRFIKSAEKDNLQSLTLDQLAAQFDDIGQQAQLLQGRILLEARSRFKNDYAFNAWAMKSPYLSSIHQTTRTRLINLAKFFSGSRVIDGISVTAAYEISAPINADVAPAVYEFARGKHLPVAEVKRQIALKKGEKEVSNLPADDFPVHVIDTSKNIAFEENKIFEEEQIQVVTTNIPLPAASQSIAGVSPVIVSNASENEIKVKVLNDVSGVAKIIAIRLLQDCIRELQSGMYK